MKKKMKKLLAVVLLAAMAITLFPVVGGQTAAYADSSVGTSGIELTKNVTLENNGTYTIDLEAYATGETTTTTVTEGVPLDIVLVIDQSGSMAYNDSGSSTSTASSRRMYKLQAAVSSFVANIAANAKEYNVDHKIAIAGFASDGDHGQSSNISGIGYNGNSSKWVNTGLYFNGSFKNYQSNNSGSGTQLTAQNYKDALVSANARDDKGNPEIDTEGKAKVNDDLTDAINLFKASGGTYTYYGLQMANNVFANNDNTYTDADGNLKTRTRIVVLFTDGDTNSDKNNTLQQANTLKNTYGATVYCVQLGNSSSNTTFLSYVSSNYTNSSYTEGGYGGYGGYGKPGGEGTYSGDAAAEQKYSFTVTNSDELKNIFESISHDATSSETSVTLDADSVLKDVISSEFDASNAEVSKVEVWNAEYVKNTNGSSASETSEDKDTAKAVVAEIDGNTVTVTNFNYSANYIAPEHEGKLIKVQITGVLPTDAAVTGAEIATNDAASGIYEDASATEATATFTQPKTILTQKAYVIDYVKADSEIALDDLDQSSVTGIYSKFQVADSTAEVDGTYGKTVLNDNELTYTPQTMKWNGYDSVYAFGKTTDSSITSVDANQANSVVWSKISVIPANNVYYEDSFVTDEATGTVGIEFSTGWTVEGEEDTAQPVAKDGEAQGWIDALAEETGDSAGSSHVAEEDATATFTFTGTGADIYTRTNDKSGVIKAKLYTVDGTKETASQILYMDNEAVSGEYYQIPTLSFHNLTYGTYKVELTVKSDSEGNSTYYLDGIRVYNPMSSAKEADQIVQDAYGETELGATFKEVRDVLKTSDSGELSDGVVFIDDNIATGEGEDANSTLNVGTYKDYGPKNEVYLANNQAILFKVNEDCTVSVGMKAADGVATTAKVTYGDSVTTEDVNSTADMYYMVAQSTGGYVEIKNTGDGLLAITKIKFTNPSTEATGASLMMIDESEAVLYKAAFDASEEVAGGLIIDEGSTKLVSAAETEQTTEEQPVEEQPTEVEVEITNPQPTEQNDQAATRAAAIAFVRYLFAGIKTILGHR